MAKLKKTTLGKQKSRRKFLRTLVYGVGVIGVSLLGFLPVIGPGHRGVQVVVGELRWGGGVLRQRQLHPRGRRAQASLEGGLVCVGVRCETSWHPSMPFSVIPLQGLRNSDIELIDSNSPRPSEGYPKTGVLGWR